MKKTKILIIITIVIFAFNLSEECIYCQTVESNNFIIDVKIKNNVYFIGDIIQIYLYTKEKPKKIYSVNDNIYLKKYTISKKKKFYLSTIEIQCFSIGTVNLNSIKIEAATKIFDLGDANIKIESFMNKFNLNFNFPDKLLIKKITIFNIIIVLISLFLIILISIVIFRNSKTILLLVIKKNNDLNKIIKTINNLKNLDDISLKEKFYYLSKIIKIFSIKINYSSLIIIDKVKYELSKNNLNKNYEFYSSKFINIADDVVKKLKEKEKIKR